MLGYLTYYYISNLDTNEYQTPGLRNPSTKYPYREINPSIDFINRLGARELHLAGALPRPY